MNKFDAIVIGSGFGGLTSAAWLAHSGAKVLVLEQHYEIGGCVSMFRRGKFHFDVAVHLVGGCEPQGEVYTLYDKLGLLDKIDFLPVDPMYELYLGDTLYEIPSNLDDLAYKLSEWFPEDTEAIQETILEFKQIGGAILSGNIGNPQIGRRLVELNRIPFADYLEGRFHHPHTSLVISSLHPYIGSNLKQLSTVIMMGVLMSYHHGAFYPRGGSQVMSNLLRDYICAQDGQVLIKRRVEKIIYDGSKVTGVIDHKGNQYHAPIVISNADMQKTMTELLDEKYFPETFRASTAKLKPSHSAIILYAVIQNEGLDKAFSHEMFFFPDSALDDDAKYLYNPMDQQTDPYIIACCPSVIDPSLAPDGYFIVSFMVFCDRDIIEKIKEEDKGKEIITDHFLQLIETKFPKLSEQMVLYELSTPSTIERYTSNHKGAIYGWAKSFDQPWLQEMGPKTPIKGLYLAGHWTPNVHGVYGVCMSGRITAETILREFPM